MDNLIDNALLQQQKQQQQSNIIKNRTCVNRYIGYCWDYVCPNVHSIDDDILTITYDKPLAKDKKVVQKCRNKICVNPEHLIEVSHDEWFKHTLDKELLWMNHV